MHHFNFDPEKWNTVESASDKIFMNGWIDVSITIEYIKFLLFFILYFTITSKFISLTRKFPLEGKCHLQKFCRKRPASIIYP